MTEFLKNYRASSLYYFINSTLFGCVIGTILYNFVPVGKFHDFDVSSFISILPGLGASLLPSFASPTNKTTRRLNWIKEQKAMNQLYVLIFGQVVVLLVTLILKNAITHNIFKALNIGVTASYFLLNLAIG